jgi:hypothetical protein
MALTLYLQMNLVTGRFGCAFIFFLGEGEIIAFFERGSQYVTYLACGTSITPSYVANSSDTALQSVYRLLPSHAIMLWRDLLRS